MALYPQIAARMHYSRTPATSDLQYKGKRESSMWRNTCLYESCNITKYLRQWSVENLNIPKYKVLENSRKASFLKPFYDQKRFSRAYFPTPSVLLCEYVFVCVCLVAVADYRDPGNFAERVCLPPNSKRTIWRLLMIVLRESMQHFLDLGRSFMIAEEFS